MTTTATGRSDGLIDGASDVKGNQIFATTRVYDSAPKHPARDQDHGIAALQTLSVDSSRFSERLRSSAAELRAPKHFNTATRFTHQIQMRSSQPAFFARPWQPRPRVPQQQLQQAIVATDELRYPVPRRLGLKLPCLAAKGRKE